MGFAVRVLGLLVPLACMELGVALDLGPAQAAESPAKSKVVYTFPGGHGGGLPYAGLIGDHGEFYGAADIGGRGCDKLGCGYIYKLTPPAKGQPGWTITILYEFAGEQDGAFPQARLRFGPHGDLFGTTTGGGLAGVGTVFRLAPPASGQGDWTETVLHAFTGRDGQTPLGRLSIERGGSIYGTTEEGGPAGNGEVYRLTPSKGETVWTLSVLHRFTGGSDGGSPMGGLIEDPSGRLYGTTMFGGAHGQGTVFELEPPGAVEAAWPTHVLYDFAGAPDGAQPLAGLAIDASGNLYGQTSQGGDGICHGLMGCGTVFKLSPGAGGGQKWTETLLHTFTGGKDGSFPNSALALRSDGTVFGTTETGGTQGCQGGGCGTVFSLVQPTLGNAAWTESVLQRFQDTDGAFPNAVVLTAHEQALLGTTTQGGTTGCNGAECGVVFKLELSH